MCTLTCAMPHENKAKCVVRCPSVMLYLLGQKSCRTKVPRIFQIFVPNFAPNFPWIFEEFSCFLSWETETRKNSPTSPAIFPRVNSQAKKITNILWRVGNVISRKGIARYGGVTRTGPLRKIVHFRSIVLPWGVVYMVGDPLPILYQCSHDSACSAT